jgi:CBS domain-containing protein
MQVKDIMTPQVEVIHPDAMVTEAVEKMSRLDIDPLPVSDGEWLVGMITDRDITVRATTKGSDPNTITAREVMTPEVICCFEDQNAETAARTMKMLQIRCVPVLDHDLQLVGIVSLGASLPANSVSVSPTVSSRFR